MKQVSTPLLLARFCVWRVHRLQFWTTRTLHGFQFLQLLLLHLRVFLCLSLILFLQFLFHKQNVRHKECKSLHLQPAENDSIYLCSEESLRTLFSFFCNTLSTSCCYCGKPLDCESLVFNRQSYVVSVTISCVGGDSFKWLSFPIMGGSPPKYYVNLKWALFYFLLEIYWNLLSRCFRVFVFCNCSLICLSYLSLFHRLIHGVLSCGLTETQYTSQAANIGSPLF